MSMFPLPAILALVAAVRLSEIQASPPVGLPEFVELSGAPGTRLSGWSLSDGTVRRPLPSGSVLAASGLLVVSPDCPGLRRAWAGADIPCATGSSWDRLSVDSDCLVLRDSLQNVTDSVCWSAGSWGPWPRGASRVRVSEALGGSDPAAWRISRAGLGASPGWLEPAEDAREAAFSLEIPRRAVRPGAHHSFRIGAGGTVRVELFDLARRSAGVVFEGTPPPGGEVAWDGRIAGRNLAPGVYLLLATSAGEVRRDWIAVGKP